ncbi:Ca2+/Na+ antiporter [Anaerosolibacter carboniphilus]|uniref:Ca2+/Na+ antiporter n=1 Tax=Anaerosolibacter carboniphilus TaxID=1417629 RepID=A0A841KS36_9FIRM|nr:MutS family DNA mismatch repair protein [Anaerosolibacter carboniphilus]MBB6216237.1 Ca2+/Na+ antiporter [Anaerosolibacter carboniphilus]
MKNPEIAYRRKQKHYGWLHKRQHQAANKISKIRLIVSLVGIIIGVILFSMGKNSMAVLGLVVTLCLFVPLVICHKKMKRKSRYSEVLWKMNEEAILRITGKWHAFADKGQDFRNEAHPYAEDLDVFGDGSLFQWINTALTVLGRKKLAEFLANPSKELEKIRDRQGAIKELANLLRWRQRFAAEAHLAADEIFNPEPLVQWLKSSNTTYGKKWLQILMCILPGMTMLLGWHSFVNQAISYRYFIAAVGIHLMILKIGRKEREAIFRTVYRYKNDIGIYMGMITWIEQQEFESPYLNRVKAQMINERKELPSKQIKRFFQVVEIFSQRYNAVFLLINILFLWDYHSLWKLERWKDESGRYFDQWLNGIGEIEALASLSIIGYDHPDWALPEILSGEPVLLAQEMGHPLLTQKCIRNDFKIKRPTSVLLITGSNMSGKSTFLRSAGVNLVLAYAGTPVYARGFQCAIMEVHTCMRVHDDLGQSISSFYAELLRIRKIIDAVKKEKPVFFLLDEIFKGTNSHDRHLGAKALIKQLIQGKTMGLVSTHDLELGDLEQETQGAVQNFHFKEYYEENELRFDYKLRSGISTTRNAMYLIKMAGIDVDNKNI